MLFNAFLKPSSNQYYYAMFHSPIFFLNEKMKQGKKNPSILLLFPFSFENISF